MFGVHLDEPRVQEFAAAHAEQEARRRHEKAVHARENPGHDRNGEDDAAEPAESHIGHGARGPAVILAEQIGIGDDDRDSDQNQRVEKRAADDGIDHQAAGFFGREVEFFSGLGDRVETHEQPRGNGEDGQHAGYRGTPFGKEGEQVIDVGGFRGDASKDQHQHAAREGEGQNELEAARHVHAPEIHIAEEDEESRHHGQFARVDVPSGDRIQIAHIKNAGQDEAAEQREGRAVGGDDAEVAENQRPAADETGPCPEADVGVGEGTARNGVDFNQNAVAERHRAQQPSADEKREACPQRPGIRQKTGSGKDEAAPADDGPYSQCPDFGRAHGFFEFLAIRLRFRRVIHISISFQFEGGKSGPGAHMVRITHGFVRPMGRNARTAECVRL